ncbi:MAG TPA: efflux RND transporter periplasmic adaptor subunit [Bryobacteraceae bacterium]|jgi:HlyD family secretion protein|nr:efflux RND transporter periplasmic adaptor subunit [Bryobacteraceae bacterium]
MKRLLLLATLPVLLVLWWALDRRDSTPQVRFATVSQVSIESSVSTNGKVEPANWAAARAETAGVVKSVAAQRGETVSAGQILVTLDTSNADASLTAALARQQEAQSELRTLAAGGKAAAVANLDDQIKTERQAIQIAQRNLESLERLLPQEAATRQQVQDARDAVTRDNLQLAALENQRRTLVTAADRTVAEAKLRDAEAAVALARHQVALGNIVAPISGTLYQFDLKVGAYLQPGDLVGLVGDIDRMKVTVYVDEPDLGRVGLNMPVHITWDARPGQVWYGKVEKLPTEVVALGTRTVGDVITMVENPNHDLLPGVSVNVVIISASIHNVPAMPKQALQTVGGVDGVYKLSGDRVVWTAVKTGIFDINNVQILSGLAVGDRVALPSDANLTNGTRVKPVRQ